MDAGLFPLEQEAIVSKVKAPIREDVLGMSRIYHRKAIIEGMQALPLNC